MSLARTPGLYDPRLKALAKLSNNPFVALFGDHNGKPFVSHQGDIASPQGGLIIGKEGLDTLDGVDDHLLIPSSLGLGTANNWTVIVGVTIPDNARKGAFVKIGGAADGFAIGVGATTFGDTGNDLIGLKEGVAWNDTNILIGTGFHTIAMFHRVDGVGDRLFYYIDGAYIATGAVGVPIAPGAETRIGGYDARHTNCKIHFVLIGESLRQGTADDDNALIEDAAKLFPAGVWEQRVLEKPRDSWFGAASGVSAALTGQSIPVATGSLTAAITAPLTGQAIPLGQGTVTVAAGAVSAALTGQSIGVALGSFSAAITAALTGHGIPLGQGSVLVGIGQPLTGQAVPIGQGSMVGAVSYSLTGQSIPVSVGSVTVSGTGVTWALTGQGIPVAAGTLTAAITAAMTGHLISLNLGSIAGTGPWYEKAGAAGVWTDKTLSSSAWTDKTPSGGTWTTL